MIQYLNYLDHSLFEWIQLNLRNETLDPVIAVFRDKYFWFPLYIFFFTWIFFHYRANFWYWIFAFVLTIVISDQLCSTVLKKSFKRIRPCNEIYFKEHFNQPIGCGSGFSMPSSHASNHMAIAILFTLGFADSMRRMRWVLPLWALIIGFAQVYVGVHFPFDVMVGFTIGLVIGIMVYLMFKSKLGNEKSPVD